MAEGNDGSGRSSWSSDESLAFRIFELETLYHEAPVGLCFLDRDLRYLRINERLAGIHGIPAADHIGKTLAEVIPTIAEQVVPDYSRVLATGQPVRGIEVRGTLPSDLGVEHVWLAHHHPVKSSDGSVTGIMTVVEDVTEATRLREELRRVKEALDRAQHVSGVGSWEWDIIEDRVWWSDELYRIYELTPTAFEPSFNGFFDMVHPEDRELVRKQLDATLERNDPYRIVYRAVLESGAVRVIEAHAVIERDEDGQPARLIGTARDVTARHPPDAYDI